MSRLERSHFLDLDARDPLCGFRKRFALPPGKIYLDGHSLGALPASTPEHLREIVEREWGQDLIAGWNGDGSGHGWVDAPLRIGEKIGRLIGARSGETLVADSTSVNLFKLLALALQLRPGRRAIVTERDSFPTDLYVAQGLATLLGDVELRCVGRAGIAYALDGALGESVAVLMLSHIDYRSGEMYDMARLTRAAHAQGALVLWDLAHSAGVMPLELTALEVDLAVGCGYKYLNGGPGAPAFLYVAQRHHGQARSPIAGWFGHAHPFDFEPNYAPASGISRMQAGTPPILSMAALETGVDLLNEASLVDIRAKSLVQTRLCAALVRQELKDFGFEIATPLADTRRGSQLSLRHLHAWPISQALIARGVIGDFRAPDILRLGFAPLYVSYTDVWDAVATLAEIMRSGQWREAHFQTRNRVT